MEDYASIGGQVSGTVDVDAPVCIDLLEDYGEWTRCEIEVRFPDKARFVQNGITTNVVVNSVDVDSTSISISLTTGPAGPGWYAIVAGGYMWPSSSDNMGVIRLTDDVGTVLEEYTVTTTYPGTNYAGVGASSPSSSTYWSLTYTDSALYDITTEDNCSIALKDELKVMTAYKATRYLHVALFDQGGGETTGLVHINRLG